MSEYFRCVLGTLRITRSVWKLSGSLEVNLELRIVQREVSIEVKNKARVLDMTNIILEVQKLRFKVQGFRTRLIFEHEHYHTRLRVLYMGVGNIALIGDIRSVENVRVGGNGGMRVNIAKLCIHK